MRCCGCAPGTGCKTSIVVPRSWIVCALLNLQTTRSPAEMLPPRSGRNGEAVRITIAVLCVDGRSDHRDVMERGSTPVGAAIAFSASAVAAIAQSASVRWINMKNPFGRCALHTVSSGFDLNKV